MLEREPPTRSPLCDRVDATPDRTALLDPTTDTTWTYRQLAADVRAAGTELRERSEDWELPPERRPRVGYLLDPSPEFVTTLYACWRLGWTPVGLHTDLAPGELQTRVEAAQLDAIVASAGCADLAESTSCPTVPAESVLGPGPDGPGEPEQPARWEPGETALVLFTSGTTGEPKGVRLTLRNLTASATASAFRLGVDPDDRWLCCLPVSHMGGLAPAVRTVLYGTTLVVQRSFDATRTAALVDECGVTHVSLVPTQLKRLLDADWSPPDALETVLLGGAPATEELLARADEAGVPVYVTYGATETASQIATARPGERRQHPESVGQPLLSTRVTVLSDGEPADPGERGELVVDGPTVAPGYLDPAHTDEAFGEFGFHTGDVGSRDEHGRLRVLGRADDVILTGGELVAPAEVIEALVAADSVAEAAVVGLPDPEWGEQVGALVVPAEGATPDEAALREVCRDELASYKVPKTVELAAEIPRTASGTVDRAAVRERLGE